MERKIYSYIEVKTVDLERSMQAQRKSAVSPDLPMLRGAWMTASMIKADKTLGDRTDSIFAQIKVALKACVILVGGLQQRLSHSTLWLKILHAPRTHDLWG